MNSAVAAAVLYTELRTHLMMKAQELYKETGKTTLNSFSLWEIPIRDLDDCI